MFRFKTVLTGLILLAGTCGSVSAQVIADYRVDYLSGTFNGQTRPAVSADGWDYMWNANAAIGTAAGNYSSLMAWGTGYNLDGAGGLPRANPAGYVSLDGTGGHPGRGQTQGGTWDRYAITAYTIQSTEGGLIQVANSAISVGSGASTGVELRVYVNDGLTTSLVRSGGGVASSFDGLLGVVNPGDTVYVAMGPYLTDGNDGFNVAYQLDTVTDPLVVVWDADGTLPVDGGAGGWDIASSRWYTGSGGGMYTTWNNGTGMNANFMATGGTVNLDVPITARSLTFWADGYTITGTNALTLTGSSNTGGQTISVVNDTDTAAISAPMTGNLSKIGDGTLTLTGATNSFNEINAAGGNLVLAGSSVTNVSNVVRVGVGSAWVTGGGSGMLTIRDSAQLTTGTILMGENWPFIAGGMTAVINQTGGTVTVTGSTGENAAIRVGHWGNETSTYNLSGGVLNITGADQDLAIGTDGAGIFYQTGGEAFATGVMVNHRNAGGSAVFTVEGGTFNVGVRGIQTAGGPATVNIGGAGGTIKASASFSSPLNMTITGGAKNGAYFDTNGNNVDLSGNLTGGGDLNKVGDGTLTLSGAANALGKIYAAGGNLVFDSGSSTTSSGMQVGANDYFVTGGGSGTATVQGTALLNTGSIVMGDNWGGPTQTNFFNQTGGTVNVTGYSTDGGAPSPNQGGLRIGHWPSETSTYNLSGGTLNLQNPAAGIMLATDGDGTFNQTGGTANAAFVKVNTRTSGSGTGIFTLEGGTFELGSGGIVTDAGPYTINLGGSGATLRAADSWSSSLPMTLTGTGANAIHLDTNGNTITLSGALSGTGQLHKVGAGTLSLTGNNTLASLVVDGGATSVLEIAGSSNTSVAGYVGIGDASFATLRIKDTAQFSPSQLLVGETGGIGGAVEHQGGTVTVAGETRIGHWPNETSTYTLSGTGNLVANGRFSVGWDGSGVFTQDGGSSQFNAGLSVAAHNSSGAATVNMNGGTMNASTLMLSDSSYGKPGTFNQTGGTVTVAGHTRIGHWNGGPSNYNLTGGTLNANGNLYVGWDGVGIMTVSGATTQLNASYIGLRGNGSVMNVLDGTVQSTGYIMLGDYAGRSTTVNQSGGTVTAGNHVRIAHWGSETSTYNLTGGTLNANGRLYVGWDGVGIMTVSGATTQLNASFIGLRGNNSVMNIQDGTVQTANFFLGEASGRSTTVNQTGGNVTANGQLRIGHYPNETSTYHMDGGTLTVNGSGTGPEQAGVITLGIDGTGILNHSAGTIAAQGLYLDARGATAGIDQYNMTGGTLEINGSLGIAGNGNTSTYRVNLGGGTVKSNATWASGSPMTFTGTNGNVTFDTNGNTVTLNGLLSGSGGLIKDGAGTLTFNADNTYTGSTVIDGGTLVLNTPHFNTYRGAGIFINNGSTFKVTTSGGANRYDFVNKTFTFDSAGGGTIDTSSGVNFVFWNPGNTFVTNGGAQNSIIGTSGFNVNAGAAATFDVTRGSGTSDLKVTARIWNSGSVVKTGDGILEFTGNNTYGGTTAVNAGTLLLNGQHTGGGLYTVAAGATLGGTGTTTSQVDLSGAVAPGSSVGTLNTGSQTWNDGGSFLFEINDVDAGPGTGWDLLNVTGSLDLAGLSNGGFEIDVASLGLDDLPGLVHDFNAGLPYEWEFVRTSDGIAGFQERDFVIDAGAFANPLSNIGSFIVYQKGDSLYLGHHVPEPSTLVLAVIGILGLGFVSWRRSSIVSKKI